MWVLPETLGGEPSYEQAGVDVSERLTPVASGLPAHDGSGAVRLGRRAALHAARAGAGTTVELPSAPLVHLFVVRGAVHVPGVGPLEDGDALRITGAAGPGLVVTASTDAELLGWELHP
jgi:redox-sensitive bicupin YhaK (pirin superfamily)